MAGGTYQAARAVAPQAHAHFSRHLAAARESGISPLAALPDVATIEAVIDAAFWASLRREEGYVPRISLAVVPPEETEHPLHFERPLRLDPAALVRVAPAVERPGIHLGIWPAGGELRVWGTTRTMPAVCFVLEVAAPGLLVIKHHRGDETGKFVNVAVLEGDQVKVIDEKASALPDRPQILASLLGFDAPPVPRIGHVNVLVSLSVSIRAHGRGGVLLLVPSGTDAWRDSIVQPIAYSVTPAFANLGALMQEPPEGRRPLWAEAVAEAVDLVGGLTAVDGATVLTDRYELLAFGAKIRRRDGSTQIERVVVTEPIEGCVPAVVEPGELGGTRHLAGAQFVHDQRDAVALVASQDGHFTVFAWTPCESMVHAHRVETLLL